MAPCFMKLLGLPLILAIRIPWNSRNLHICIPLTGFKPLFL